MPQFDKITFFNQLFWLLFFFSGFYLLLLHFFLPKLSAVLKARSKMLKFYLDGVSSMFEERTNTLNSFEKDCMTPLSQKNSIIFLIQVTHLGLWVSKSVFVLLNRALKQGFAGSESHLYKQTLFFSVLFKLKASEDFFSGFYSNFKKDNA